MKKVLAAVALAAAVVIPAGPASADPGHGHHHCPGASQTTGPVQAPTPAPADGGGVVVTPQRSIDWE